MRQPTGPELRRIIAVERNQDAPFQERSHHCQIVRRGRRLERIACRAASQRDVLVDQLLDYAVVLNSVQSMVYALYAQGLDAAANVLDGIRLLLRLVLRLYSRTMKDIFVTLG